MFGLINFYVLVIFVLSRFYTVSGNNYLLLPVDHFSHVNFFLEAGIILTKAGHRVTLVCQDRHQKNLLKLNSSGVEVLYGTGPPMTELLNKLIKTLETKDISQAYYSLTQLTNILEKQVTNILDSDIVMDKLRVRNFDLALVDGIPFNFAAYIIPYKLNVSYFTLGVMNNPYGAGVPAMPSIEPFFGLTRFTNNMTFFERLCNFFVYLAFNTVMSFILPSSAQNKRLVEKYINADDVLTVRDLPARSQMWLVNLETRCLDYPRIQAPNYVYIGGLGASPGQQLQPNILDVMDSASNGVVVVTFGSLFKDVPVNVLQKLLKAFSEIKEKVVMRHSSVVDDAPSNVLLLKWLPQNDLLGKYNWMSI